MSSSCGKQANLTSQHATSDATASGEVRPAFSMASVARLIIFVLIVTALVYLYYQGELTQDRLKQIAAALPTWLFLPAFFILPLLGFPISVALLASGMKFGFGYSIAIAVFGMGFHTFVAWHLAHGLFRSRLEHWLRSTRFEMPSIPKNHQIWFTSLFVTVPGLPYAVKLYSLALTNLSFRRYFLIVWLFHVLNAVPFIGIGIAAAQVSATWLVGISILALGTVLVSHWLKKRFSPTRLGQPEKPDHSTPNA